MLRYIFRQKQSKASEYEKKPARILPADSPITLAYQGPGPYLATVSPDSCRSNYFGWLASENPFVKTLREGKLEYNESLLKRSEEHTSELQSRENLVCRLLLEKKK